MSHELIRCILKECIPKRAVCLESMATAMTASCLRCRCHGAADIRRHCLCCSQSCRRNRCRSEKLVTGRCSLRTSAAPVPTPILNQRGVSKLPVPCSNLHSTAFQDLLTTRAVDATHSSRERIETSLCPSEASLPSQWQCRGSPLEILSCCTVLRLD